jgi:hypothetical protein
VSPVKYELGFYISEDGILHSHRHENLTCGPKATEFFKNRNTFSLQDAFAIPIVFNLLCFYFF